jgi:outer membrane murein-binding lipoprotein Lpp
MTDVWIDPPHTAAFGSTPNATTRTDTAPQLELRRDSKPGEGPDVPRRARALRAATTIVGVVALLSIGLGVGLKANEFVNAAQVSAWSQDAWGAMVSNLDSTRKQMVASIEGLTSGSGSQETPNEAPRNVADVIEQVARGSFVKMDQVRASLEAAIREVGRGVERLDGSVERSRQDQRDLLAKLDQLQARLERVEHHFASTSSTRQAPPEQAAAAKPAAALPQQPSAAPAAAPPTTPPAHTRRVENWSLREVVDGMAVLAGPEGLIGVFSGDVVPGVGRVQSISRRGGRWVVATTRGVITADKPR